MSALRVNKRHITNAERYHGMALLSFFLNFPESCFFEPMLALESTGLSFVQVPGQGIWRGRCFRGAFELWLDVLSGCCWVCEISGVARRTGLAVTCIQNCCVASAKLQRFDVSKPCRNPGLFVTPPAPPFQIVLLHLLVAFGSLPELQALELSPQMYERLTEFIINPVPKEPGSVTKSCSRCKVSRNAWCYCS